MGKSEHSVQLTVVTGALEALEEETTRLERLGYEDLARASRREHALLVHRIDQLVAKQGEEGCLGLANRLNDFLNCVAGNGAEGE